jgi:ribosomal protein S18 acetylase RimI-like enzyme
MKEHDDCVEAIFMGDERRAIDFLQGDPYRNIWTISTLKRYGAFNLGLPEQGTFYGYYESSGSLTGLLYCNNLGFWRFHASSEAVLAALLRAALSDDRKPVSITGDPAVLEGALEREGRSLTVQERELEAIHVLKKDGFTPSPDGKARVAGAADADEMVELEKGLQVHLLGRAADNSFLRRRVLEVAEKGRAAVLPDGRHLAAKAELEVEIDGCSQLSGVFTRPEARGRGAATAVCALICGVALAEGREVCLETQADNQVALALYAGIGFRKHGDSLVTRLAEA